MAPRPGKTVAVVGVGLCELMPRSTSSVPPECHGLVAASAQIPKPLVASLGRRMPIAWNGPVIHRSMWLRAVADELLLTATLPLLPAVSPPGV